MTEGTRTGRVGVVRWFTTRGEDAAGCPEEVETLSCLRSRRHQSDRILLTQYLCNTVSRQR